MGKNRKKQGKPQRIRLFHQNLCEAHGKSYKKAAFAQSLSTEDSGRKSIPADIHPQYIPQRANHRISANTNPQPIRQLTPDTQKAPRRVNPAGCFSVHCFSFQKAYFVAYWMKR